MLGLLVLSVYSYFSFMKAPGVKVQGLKTTSELIPTTSVDYFTPVPSKTIEIGSDTSSDSRSQVLESAKSADDLKNFYKNFFYMQEWNLVDESTENNFYILEFRQGTKSVKITISSQDLEQPSSLTVKQPVLVNVQEFF